MDRYALIDADGETVLDRRALPVRPDNPVGKGWKWLPIEETVAEYDPDTETLTDWSETVMVTKVKRLRSKRSLTADELMPRFSSAVQMHLDAKASERQYDGIQTAVTYRDDPNAQFAAEGQALFEWRSAVWSYAMAELAKVQAGTRAILSVDALVTELPAFAWPEVA
jgi:hypothetical protein